MLTDNNLTAKVVSLCGGDNTSVNFGCAARPGTNIEITVISGKNINNYAKPIFSS